ncbi:MAG: toxin-antitoxin system YwqK family antitoxin [Candidatus Omnitrophica bacterium]|nr:toxin-antitoxin system YwqK family antitoxin [Candidatus Omnitrophota bacterium]MDE2214657.1 toxin-antitoxin system YwqK family antitoxin [Candidatus Omnitrophota bacterium]MDE2232019.1 toxin-antitoxin system YwqK family antitoxin [Candidatus Omnitrophota bacterium]
MKITIGLLALFMAASPWCFAQSVINPARLYEQARGTQSPVDGVWHVYDRNGHLLREENYQNYRLNGPMKIFYPSGALKELLYYSDGLRQGDDKAYYENGGLEFEDNYDDNDLNGPSVHYYDTGEVKSREHYTDGKLDGERTVLYKDGMVKQSMYYIAGRLDGAVDTYAEDGKILVEELYIKGNLVAHHDYGPKAAAAKNGIEANAAPPTPNNAPAPADMPTKLGNTSNSSYANP